jgi:hypothetical protein
VWSENLTGNFLSGNFLIRERIRSKGYFSNQSSSLTSLSSLLSSPVVNPLIPNHPVSIFFNFKKLSHKLTCVVTGWGQQKQQKGEERKERKLTCSSNFHIHKQIEDKYSKHPYGTQRFHLKLQINYTCPLGNYCRYLTR